MQGGLEPKVRCEQYASIGRRAVCSELRVVRVRVRDGVLVVHRIWLKHDVVVRKVVRNVVAII